MAALVQDMTPHETGPLFRALCSSDALRRQLSDEEDSDQDNMDVTLMEPLAECYQAASRWETRRQILSIMADKVRYKTLLKFIPGLTKYRFTEAKRHCLTYGRGAPVQSVEDVSINNGYEYENDFKPYSFSQLSMLAMTPSLSL